MIFYPFFKGDTIKRTVGIHSLSVSGLGKVDTGRVATQSYRLYHGESFIEETAPITLSDDLKYEAYLGVKWFKDYILIINSTEREYILLPRDAKSPSADSSFGIVIYPVDGLYKIIKKNLDDPLIPDEISLMQEVKQINGKDLGSFRNECGFFTFYRDTVLENERMTVLLEGQNSPIEIIRHSPTKTVLR